MKSESHYVTRKLLLHWQGLIPQPEIFCKAKYQALQLVRSCVGLNGGVEGENLVHVAS